MDHGCTLLNAAEMPLADGIEPHIMTLVVSTKALSALSWCLRSVGRWQATFGDAGTRCDAIDIVHACASSDTKGAPPLQLVTNDTVRESVLPCVLTGLTGLDESLAQTHNEDNRTQ